MKTNSDLRDVFKDIENKDIHVKCRPGETHFNWEYVKWLEDQIIQANEVKQPQESCSVDGVVICDSQMKELLNAIKRGPLKFHVGGPS